MISNYSHTMMNFSDSDSPCPDAISIFFTTSTAFLSMVAVLGNILVIVAVYKTRNLRTSTNYYYVNMAISDFLSSLTIWPLYLSNEIITSRGSLFKGSLATAGCKVGVFFRMTSVIVSILSLVLIAVDRFIATVFPLKSTLVTGKVRTFLLFATWTISMAYCFPMLYYSRAEDFGQETYCKFAWNSSALMIYYITGLALFEIAPIIAIVILYSRVMSVLQKRIKPGTGARNSSSYQYRRNEQNRNILKIFKSIVVMFFISFSFFFVYLILKMTFPELFVKDKCKWILGFAYFLFPSLSSVINPIILFAFSTNFRQALRKLWMFSLGRFFCGRKEKSELVEAGGLPAEETGFKSMAH